MPRRLMIRGIKRPSRWKRIKLPTESVQLRSTISNRLFLHQLRSPWTPPLPPHQRLPMRNQKRKSEPQLQVWTANRKRRIKACLKASLRYSNWEPPPQPLHKELVQALVHLLHLLVRSRRHLLHSCLRRHPRQPHQVHHPNHYQPLLSQRQ